MIKKLSLAVAAVLVTVVAASNVAYAAPKKDIVIDDDHKVTICHGTNSVTNPYTRPTVDDDAADGNTGNDKGKGDHSTHTGPIATSPAVAQDLKNSKTAWGDIIPPHDNYAGLNWNAEGMAIYYNNCEYVEPNFDLPLITATVGCAEVEGVQKVHVVLTNDGEADGVAVVNGEEVPVAANSTVNLYYDNNTAVTVVIDRQVVFNEVVTCGGRGGSENPETPVTTTPQVNAPKGGVGAGAGQTAVVAAMIASVISLAYGVIRLRKFGL